MSALILRSASISPVTQCCVLPRLMSTSAVLCKNKSAKYKTTPNRSRLMTYDMAMRPQYIGVRKAWLSWHTQDLEDFRQTQPYQVAQDEIIRRFMRGLFIENMTRDGEELVIKRRGNLVVVCGFLKSARIYQARKVYWMVGFAEEFLSLLLKQPVRLELQVVDSEKELAYTYI